MESKKLNVTEEWLRVITKIALDYRKNLNKKSLSNNQEIGVGKMIGTSLIPVKQVIIKQESQRF